MGGGRPKVSPTMSRNVVNFMEIQIYISYFYTFTSFTSSIYVLLRMQFIIGKNNADVPDKYTKDIQYLIDILTYSKNNERSNNHYNGLCRVCVHDGC
jgi:hypothetical protein